MVIGGHRHVFVDRGIHATAMTRLVQPYEVLIGVHLIADESLQPKLWLSR